MKKYATLLNIIYIVYVYSGLSKWTIIITVDSLSGL